ncbi:MAG: lysophospholipid acyltransferase family protein [Crocinitomicaceae bacterium]|nr:lysophospholipid acyltransferase family protein [Crocinitomicaceae bacterium]
MLYNGLKILVRIGIRIYYSEVKIRNKSLLAHNGPKIIIANHPNALMDAWLIGTISDEPIYYMTKASFFNNKLKMWFLRSLNMIPINRASEAKIDGVDNNSTLEECYQLLGEGKTLVIFPEGTSNMELLLRQLKSGTARIALEAERRNQGKLNLKVIPIGLMYTQGEKFRSSIMVNIGEGIHVTQYLEEYETNHTSAARKLTNKFREMLENVLITTQNKDQESLITSLTETLQSRYLHNAIGVESELSFMKKIRDRIELYSIEQPWKIEKIQKLLANLKWNIEKKAIKDDFLDRGLRSRMFVRQILMSIIALIIGFPLYIIGLIHNILPFKLTDTIILKSKMSKEYYAAIAILLGLLLYPLNYALFIYLFSTFLNVPYWAVILYGLSLPFLGIYSYYFARYLRHISYKIKYTFLVMNNRAMIIELKKKRKELFNLLFED